MNAKAATCPSDEMLADYGLGKLDGAGSETIHQHLETCVDCRQFVASLSGDSFVNRLRDAQAKPPMADAPAQRVRTFVAGESIPNLGESSETPLPASRKLELVGSSIAGKPPGTSSLANVPPELANHPDYELLKELGRGGMGVVYLARNRMMDRLEVLKVVSNSLLERPGARERFQQEIRSAAKLAHPNIVAAYSVLRPGDLLVFAMEYVEGQDLSQVVKQRGPLPITNATFYIQQVASGLQHAHDKGMVHRDIKPNNLMLAIVNKKHVVKILDFGLAKATSEKGFEGGLTKSGQMMGTPDYVAPEQMLDAQKADIRADIYSLGCTLYFLLSGHPPFQGNSLYEILQAHHQAEARPLNLLQPDVPAELAAIVAKMMAKDPAKRFQTPAEVGKVLRRYFKAPVQGVAGANDLPPRISQSMDSPTPDGFMAATTPVPAFAPPIPIALTQTVVPSGTAVSLSPMDPFIGDERPPARLRKRSKVCGTDWGILIAILFLGVMIGGASLALWRTQDFGPAASLLKGSSGRTQPPVTARTRPFDRSSSVKPKGDKLGITSDYGGKVVQTGVVRSQPYSIARPLLPMRLDANQDRTATSHSPNRASARPLPKSPLPDGPAQTAAAKSLGSLAPMTADQWFEKAATASASDLCFAMLEKSRSQAIESADIAAAMRVVDELDRRFVLDCADVQISTLKQLYGRVRSPAGSTLLAETTLSCFNKRSSQPHSGWGELLKTALLSVRLCGDDQLITQVRHAIVVAGGLRDLAEGNAEIQEMDAGSSIIAGAKNAGLSKPLAVRDLVPQLLINSLTGFWQFDEQKGEIVKDALGHSDGKLMHGTARTNGRHANGLKFDGVDDFVEFPAMDFGNRFTIALWLKPDSVSHHFCLISNDDSGVHEGWGFAVSRPRTSDARLCFRTGSDGGRESTESAPNAIVSGKWQMIVVAVNKDKQLATLYLDAKPLPRVAAIAKNFRTDGKWRLGTFVYPRIDWPFDGILDDLILFNRELTASEVRSLYAMHIRDER